VSVRYRIGNSFRHVRQLAADLEIPSRSKAASAAASCERFPL
jgi:hypothetical protein